MLIMDNQNDQLCLSNVWCSPIHRKQRRLGTMDMIVWLRRSSSQKRGMLARHRWTGMDEPNSTSRDDWAAALRRAHFLVFFSGAKGLEDAHGRGAGEAFAAGEPSSRELCAQWLTERQSSSRRCSGCTGSRPHPCASSTAIRHGTRGVGAERGGVTRATSRYTGLKRGSTPRC